MNLGTTFISKLDNVLLNPSASAPPPNWLDADCLAICLAISATNDLNSAFEETKSVSAPS